MQITKNTDGTITLTAPVMVPGAKDCDYENGETPLTTEEVKQFAESYKRYGFIDHEHGLTRNGRKIGIPTDSFLLTHDTNLTLLDGSLKSYPKGTWMVTSTLTDEAAIQTALSGGYTGYSASVFTRSRADKYLAALKSDKDAPLPKACKSIVSSMGNSLIKDVPDPVVLSISLTKKPCLHESKFCTINESDMMTEEVKSMKSKILDAMGMSEQAEVEALKSEVVSLQATIEEMKTEFAESLKSMQESFEETLKNALTPVAEKSEQEEAEEEAAEEEGEKAEEEQEEDADEAEEEEEAEEPAAEKGHSKAEPVHDNLEAQKSRRVNIYEAMGRNPDGTRKR